MPIPINRFLNIGAVVTAGPAGVGPPISNIGLPTGAQEGPRITWDITRDLTPEPDRGIIEIWNLDPSMANAMRIAQENAETGLYRVTLSFGWDSKPNLWAVMTPYDVDPQTPVGPVDNVTRFNCADGGIAYRDTAMSQSLQKADWNTILNVIALQMKLGISPSSLAVFQAAAAASPVKIFDNYSLYGDASDRLTDLCETLKLEWIIQNDTIVIIPAGVPTAGDSVILTPETGLLTYAPESDGSITCTALASPGILPGPALAVLDEFKKPIADGVFRAYSVRCVGDTNSGATMTIRGKKALIGF